MHLTSFIKHLETHGELPEHLINELRKRCEHFNIQERTTLIAPGEISKFIYFINEGLFRKFRVLEHQQNTIGFSGPGEFVGDGEGFLNRKISDIGVVSHSKASGIKIRKHDWNSLCDDNTIFLELSRNILLQQLLKMERQSVIYRTGDAKEKLNQLCRLYPGITNMVPRKHIGDYLGTTEQGISNILYKERKCTL